MVGLEGGKEDPLSFYIYTLHSKALSFLGVLAGALGGVVLFLVFFSKGRKFSGSLPHLPGQTCQKMQEHVHPPLMQILPVWACKILCTSYCFAESQNKSCHQSHLLRLFITYSQNAPGRGYFVSHSCATDNHRKAPHHFCTAEGSWPGELNGQPDQSHGSRPGDTQPPASVNRFSRMPDGSFILFFFFFFSVLGLC